MPKTPSEPTNLVLEQLRLMRGEIAELGINLRSEMAELRTSVEADMKGLKTVMRAYGKQQIAEIYKANITVANFADFETRLGAVERKVFL